MSDAHCVYPTYVVRLPNGKLVAPQGLIPADREIELTSHLEEKSWEDLPANDKNYWQICFDIGKHWQQ